ncbi:MAG: glycoside hydrolase family 15 protein, partial [Rhodobacteraceae bacterium]|nr:glycoside hydrolase family 15 protein [Paracoccaceae bacterium]
MNPNDDPHGNLNLAVIGNCTVNALIDTRARIVWSCMPRFDSDPIFNALLTGKQSGVEDATGMFDVCVDGLRRTEQHYMENTAVVVTRLEDEHGQILEVVDFAPRFNRFGRRFRPMALVRYLKPIKGTPRIRLRIRPTFDYGAQPASITRGANHVRYVGPDHTVRLTTNAPVTYVLGEDWFHLERPLSFFLGPDESLTIPVEDTTGEFLDLTVSYWREWVRTLAVPLEWQEAVIRAAITLKLCWFEETGAIVAAMTTSIPEASGTERTWDYRYCWLRDAYYVVRALNRLGAVDIMESYLNYLRNLPGVANGNALQPVYGIGLEGRLTERFAPALAGYRGQGPVRIGNQAHEHRQHDVYGQVVLSSAQAFFDRRLLRPMNEHDFVQLEKVGKNAIALHNQPDAGLWELRSKSRIHTYSSAMCWAACERLAKIADHLGLSERTAFWRDHADTIRQTIETNAWNAEENTFAGSFGGREIDASLLQLGDIGLIAPEDPRFIGTVRAVEKHLLRNGHVFRYAEADDFGVPRTAFNVCTFWLIDALSRIGERDKAREIFATMLAARNHVGLLSEDTDPATGEMWGNFPQT